MRTGKVISVRLLVFCLRHFEIAYELRANGLQRTHNVSAMRVALFG